MSALAAAVKNEAIKLINYQPIKGDQIRDVNRCVNKKNLFRLIALFIGLYPMFKDLICSFCETVQKS